MNFVNRVLGLQNNLPYTCWSDFQIVLNWIRSDATHWKQFVRNRVQEIQDLTSPDKWRFCPGNVGEEIGYKNSVGNNLTRDRGLCQF